ncbi:UNVERIFIED_CONTAM: hypothetical protein RMT77_006606 [Armadillidium vulgare]
MADERREMEGALPTKRARFEFYNNIEEESSKSSDSKFISISESFSGSGESTLTSDSGFNEFTPPQSIDDDIPNLASSSQTYSFERNDFTNKINDGEEISQKSSLMEEEEDNDDAVSVGSTASDVSGLSDFSGKDWKPCAGPMSWVQQQMEKGVNPRTVLTHLLGNSFHIQQGVSDFMLWHFIVNMLSEPPKRERLRHINTLEDVIRLIKVCKKIIVLTGAGVSVSCGIPDFRSKDGIYSRLAIDFPDLPDPQAMFDINYFRKDPRPFFKFAKEIYPGQFTPSLCHRFIRLLEQNNKLLRNYTQNIDTLEKQAGIKNVIECHGSFATATCQKCAYKVDAEEIKDDVFAQHIPMCPLCSSNVNENEGKFSETKSPHCTNGKNKSVENYECNRVSNTSNSSGSNVRNSFESCSESDVLGNNFMKDTEPPSDPVMKPDIVFFGEGLPDEFHDKMAEDKDECDLLIVIGSSLKVRPVALIPSSIHPHVPQILINREPLTHMTFDVELLGDCDVIVSELCRRLNDSWKELATGVPLSEIQELPPRSSDVSESNSAKTPPDGSLQEAPHPKDESDIEALRACWAPKVKESMAARLPDGKFLFCGGHRYVFPGAEVYYDPDDDEDDDDDSKSSQQSDSDGADTEEPMMSNSNIGEEETNQQIASRRSSQALSEDVDSLLSTASCDPINNTPDYTSEGNWGGSLDTFGGDLGHNNSASGGNVVDWTSLSASLATDSISNKHVEVEENFELDESSGKKGKIGRPQSARCSV